MLKSPGNSAGSLRELRLKADLTQTELGRLCGMTASTICYIERGKHKPRGLTLTRIMAALPKPSAEAEKEQTPKGPAPVFPGEILGRDEFFLRLRPKLSRSLGLFFNEFLITSFLENAEFFSRQRYYPGDFATAVELLGALLRAQRTLSMPAVTEAGLRVERGRCRKKRSR